jgi:hypothetical protein
VARVQVTSEEELRALLDERGVLRDGALERPERGAAFVVFAQRPDARLDVDALKSQADQFFGAKIGLTVDKHYGVIAPPVDAARVIVSVANDETASGTRLVYGCPVDVWDLGAAAEAERVMGTYGLALLARRCKTVWTIVPDLATADADRVALTIAAIFASTMLGPIVTPGGKEIFGVKGARAQLSR